MGFVMQIVGRFFVAFSLAVTGASLSFADVEASTLKNVKSRGAVVCGVSQGLPGFSNPDNQGSWTGMDVDVCRALAAAVFGNPKAVKYTALSAKERITALQSGEVDLLARNTTWSMHRDTALGVDFVAVNYFDGQGFMVRKDLGVRSAKELDGATLCTNQGTTTELNAADYFRANKMKMDMVAFEKADEAIAAYNTGRCDAYTTDHSALYAQRLKLTDPKAHIVLPEIISKEPLSPVVRQGDDNWADIVQWAHYATVAAEELGVTSKNIDRMKSSKNPSVRRLLGLDGTFGDNLGIRKDWAYQIIRHVGNYGEIFERNVGLKTPLGIKRGLNQLWTKGGLQYAPPIR